MRSDLTPIVRPRLAEPPREPDVVVIGAGAAGIGAARRLLAEGLTVAVVEAGTRVGGRAVTVALRGHPIDLGAHWLHAGSINPLVALGTARGEPLRRAPRDGHLVVGRRRGTRGERATFDRAFEVADRAMTLSARTGEDRAAATALPVLGPWRERIATIHGLLSGRPLGEVSLHDFPSMEYGENWFIAGGFGAYIARLAQGLPIRLGAGARRVDWSGRGVAVETEAGTVRARAAVVTVPVMVLQAGGVSFAPALPDPVGKAIAGFTSGTYEHVVLHWPGSPFRRPDRLASVIGGRHKPPGLLTRIDGTPFHYFELDHPSAARLDARGAGEDPARHFAREVLRAHFGARAIADLAIPLVTAWRREPLARGSWAAVPPGHAGARGALKAPVADRIWFAGEALSHRQWGTAGGAWEEGERAAGEIAAALGRASGWQAAPT